MKSIQMLANLRDHATNRTDRLTPGTVSVVLSAMMLVLIMLGTPASAQTFSVLYNFGTNNGDPTDPANGTVTQGQDGNLYGASWNGGINICGDAGVTCGSVFRITPDGALSVIYNDRGEFYRDHVHPRNPSLVLVDPEVLTRAPGMYLRAGILDSMAKWFEGRSVYPYVPNPDLQTNMAIHLAEVLYQGHRKHALEAVHLNSEGRLGYDLSQTLDLVLLLTGVIQTLAKGTLFTAVAHPLHNGLTVMEESRGVLHGLKVGYGIIVQLWIEKRPKREFEDVLSFFQQLGLEPSLQGLNLPSDPEIIRRVAEKAAGNAERGPLGYPVNNVVIERAMRELEQRLA